MTLPIKYPFKGYTVLCNSTILDAIFCSADLYRLYVLSLTDDKITRTTDTTIQQLAGFVGESTSNYTGNGAFTDKISKCADIQLVTKFVESTTSTPKKRNYYKFKQPKGEDIFRIIHRDFFDVDLPIKIKGYLIKLYGVANINTLFMNKTKAELEKLLHIGHNTITSYNKILADRGLIEIVENGLFITCPGFVPITKRTESTEKVLLAYEYNLNVAIDEYNKNHSKSLSIETLTKSDLFKLNLDKSTATFAYYYVDQFSKVKNINSLAYYLITGVSRKAQLNEAEPNSEIIII